MIDSMFTLHEWCHLFEKASHPVRITHMGRRWGTPQNLFLAFTDELEKQIFIKKAVEVGQ